MKPAYVLPLPTQEDFERILRNHTRHAAHYNVERTAQILHMKYVQGCTYAEIADHFHVSKGAIQVKVTDAVYKLLYATLTPEDKELLCRIQALRKKLGW